MCLQGACNVLAGYLQSVEILISRKRAKIPSRVRWYFESSVFTLGYFCTLFCVGAGF